MRCFGCGAVRELASGARIGFRDSCETCDVDLHVCLNCVHHDPAAYNECRESSAERVADRDRANRCEYFRPRAGEAAAGGAGAASDPMRDMDRPLPRLGSGGHDPGSRADSLTVFVAGRLHLGKRANASAF